VEQSRTAAARVGQVDRTSRLSGEANPLAGGSKLNSVAERIVPSQDHDSAALRRKAVGVRVVDLLAKVGPAPSGDASTDVHSLVQLVDVVQHALRIGGLRHR